MFNLILERKESKGKLFQKTNAEIGSRLRNLIFKSGMPSFCRSKWAKYCLSWSHGMLPFCNYHWFHFQEKLFLSHFGKVLQNAHSVVISEIYSQRKNISSNHLFSNSFSKHVAFTKFYQKCVRVNFRNYHTMMHLYVHKKKHLLPPKKYAVKSSL